MIVAIASGKGGTGKTTVATGLASCMGNKACLLDCDVEEPNCHLFLKGQLVSQRIVTTPIPVIDASICTNCGKCAAFCEYGAIAAAGDTPLIFTEMCHSCGGCLRLCPEKAMSEKENRIGVISKHKTKDLTYFEGRIDIGTPLVPPLIEELKRTEYKEKHLILDAPPGTSCPVIATLKDVDYVVMVTEPTPFGLHDLKLALDVVRVMNIPFGVVINRATNQNTPTHELCQNEGIKILAEIPQDRRIAEHYAKGDIFSVAIPEYKHLFTDLAQKVFVQ